MRCWLARPTGLDLSLRVITSSRCTWAGLGGSTHTHTHTLPLHTSRTHGRHSRCSCLTAPSPRWHRMCGLACFVREMCDSVDSACSPRVLRLTVGIHVNVGNTARARYNVFSHSLHPLCSRSRRHADGHCLQGPPRTTDDRCVSVTPVGAGGCVGPLARTRSVPSTVALSRPCRSACIHTHTHAVHVHAHVIHDHVHVPARVA